jgi:hypothetical protein
MDCDSLLPLHNGADRSVREVHHLSNLCERSNIVKLRDVSDLFLLRLTLSDQRKPTLSSSSGANCGNALISTDLERRNHLWENDNFAKWNERESTEAAWHRSSILVSGGYRFVNLEFHLFTHVAL